MGHPLEKFRYCPVCGSADWTENNVKSKRCGACGFVYYANPSAATAAFIVNDRQELLVVRRAKEPAKGTLDLPGGFVDMDETGEEGMRREIMEETGLHVQRMDFLFSIPNLYVYSGMTVHTIDLFFLCTPANGEHPRAADDAADCAWVPLVDVNPADFGLTSIRQGVTRFLRERL
jgi:ADP-ribose pyrophosphatase YjhB (NUDIX family)